ncbi:MAG TPA: response regulator [Tepidisphaeraceae bacterium]|nr:response regulator [Tepidisphaeraceae bacterium]
MSAREKIEMNRCSILYVEDNPDDVLLLQFAFEKAGIKNPLHIVGDGQQAIDYLSGAEPYNDRSQHPLPGLMLLDLNLPRVMGFDVLKWVRQQGAVAGLVVVVLSSSDLPGDIQRAYQLGANSFVSKPPDLHKQQELARALQSWWLQQNRFGYVFEPNLPAHIAAQAHSAHTAQESRTWLAKNS